MLYLILLAFSYAILMSMAFMLIYFFFVLLITWREL